MCQGFGGIVTRDGRVLFCEPDGDGDCSHSELLTRLGMKDNKDKFLRHFVRFEFPDWEVTGFRWDEDDTLPGWVTEDHAAACAAPLLKVAPAEAEYRKVCAPAYAEYEKVCAAAEAEYEKVRAAAKAEFIQKLSTIPGYVPQSVEVAA